MIGIDQSNDFGDCQDHCVGFYTKKSYDRCYFMAVYEKVGWKGRCLASCDLVPKTVATAVDGFNRRSFSRIKWITAFEQ